MGASNFLNYGIAAIRLFRVLLDKGLAFKVFITQHIILDMASVNGSITVSALYKIFSALLLFG